MIPRIFKYSARKQNCINDGLLNNDGLRNQIVQTAKAAVVGAGALVDLSMSGDDDITMFDDTEYPPAEAGVGSTAMVGAAAAALALLNLQQVRHARA